MKKTLLALTLVLCILLMNFAYAEDVEIVNGTYKTGLKIAAEPITLRVAVARHTGDQTTSYAVKPFVKRSVEDTGLNFEWIEMVTDVSAQLSVMLASGDDIPDIFLCNLGDLFTKNKELFAELQDMIPEWAPNVKAYYDEYGIDWDHVTEDDGKIYRLLTGMYSNPGNIPGNMHWIEKSWLENLDLEMPTNTDELYDVLTAFKEQDADGDGDPDNEIPLNFCEVGGVGIARWGVSWGVAGSNDDVFYVIKDGEVTPTVDTDAYREFLEYFHMLYEEGLINPEGFTQTMDQYNASLKAQKVGLWTDWSPQMQRGTTADAERCTFAGVITVPGQEDLYLFPGNNSVSVNRHFQISANCKHKEAALRWWDYLSSTDELRWLTGRGPEGLCWRYGEDGVTHYVYSPDDEEEYALFEKYGMTEDFDVSMAGASFYMDSHFPLIDKNTSYAPPAEGEFMSQGYMRSLGQAVLGDKISEGMPNNVVPNAIKEEYTFTCEGLVDYITSFRASAIINGVTDESWDNYLSELEDYNYDYYIKYYQMQFDGEFE